MASQGIHGHGNTQVQIVNSPNAQVCVDGRQVADLVVPAFRQPLDPNKKRDIDLLLARHAITDLVGREALWADCLDWCNRPHPVLARCITGRGGSGKTRFATEFVHHLRDQCGWDGYFVRYSVRKPFDLWATTRGDKKVLLVFDYATDLGEVLAETLQRLANHAPREAEARLRVLLLARTASWEEGWLRSLATAAKFNADVEDLFALREPTPLEPLGQQDRAAIFAQALTKAAEFAGVAVPALPHAGLFEQERAKETLRDPLTLMMAAVIGVRTGVPQALALTRPALAQQAAELLVARRLEKAFPDNSRLALHMAAYVTLCGGLPENEARQALVTEAGECSLGAVANPQGFVDRLHGWLPGDGAGVGPIEPDVVGEAFVLGAKSPRVCAPEAAVLRAAARRPGKVVQTLIHAVQDFCLDEAAPRTEPLEWLERIIVKGEAEDISLLLAVEAELPQSSVVLRPAAVRVTSRILERLRTLAAAATPGATDSELNGELARILNNLSVRQSELGLRDEALATALEAVGLRRELVARNRDAFLPDLAGSLNNLATRQSAVGLRDEALEAAREAVGLYRELVARNRDAFSVDLARSCGSLGSVLAGAESFGEAAEAFAEGLRTVLPYAERHPRALAGLAVRLMRSYAAAAEKAGQGPDRDLMAEAMRILGPHL